jgi:mono/diheme cytochrome c family protein
MIGPQALHKFVISVATLALSAAASAAPQTICGFSGGDPGHGKAIYAKACVSCHGANGRGTLRGSPDLTKKGGVLAKPHTAMEDHIIHGYRSPNSRAFMPPRGGKPGLSDQDMKDVHAYLHKAFGCG